MGKGSIVHWIFHSVSQRPSGGRILILYWKHHKVKSLGVGCVVKAYHWTWGFGESCYLGKRLASHWQLDIAWTLLYVPVTTLTCAMPCESLRTTPIWDGVAPFFASLQIWSTTCSGVVFNHAGGVREYGMAEADMPFPLLWRRPMATSLEKLKKLAWISK